MADITLSVIIPYYTETTREIFPLLASLNGQVGIDFEKIECILVNDGNQNELPQSFLGLFTKLPLRCLFMEKNQGPGMARQMGLDHAQGDYVMFCDADDTLHNVGVLGAFFKVIEDEYPDMIGSPWFGEQYDRQTGSRSYVLHDQDFTWLHGKAFLRSFLAEKQIRFHEKLKVHEDTYFLTLTAMETEDIYWSAVISYIWKYREDSITRRNNCAYNVDSVLWHVEALSCAYAAARARHPEKLGFLITEMMVYYYFNLHQKIWREPANGGQLRRTESALRDVFTCYRKYFDGMPPEEIAALYNRQREKQFTAERENETFYEWLTRLTELPHSAAEGAALLSDERTELPHSMERTRTAIIGTNAKGKFLKEAIENSVTHTLLYFCDETGQAGKRFEGTDVVDLKRLAGLYHENAIDMVVIANISQAYRQIMAGLAPLGITRCYVVNQFFYAEASRGAPAGEFIAADTAKPDLSYYETHIADHCNLNCRGCTHYSNLAAPRFADLDGYRKDLDALRKLYWNVTNIRLMGGEPLLNPELPEFIKATRLAFPAANIGVVTNGLLIEKQPAALFQTMKTCRCAFHVSAYPPIYAKREELAAFLAGQGVLWAFSGDTIPIRTFHKNGVLDEQYCGDPVKSFRRKKCGKTILCNFLRDGWLYPCGSFPFDEIFESCYNVKFHSLSEEERQGLRINIRATDLDGWEINRILDGPHEACRYCDPEKERVLFPWAVRGKKDVPMEDWLL